MKIKNLMFYTAAAVLMAAAAASASENKAPVKAERTTLENLQTAFNGESNAKARYEAFAVKAEAEGYKGAAALFRAAAFAEALHASKHAKVIESMGAVPVAEIKPVKVRTTAKNLRSALAGETSEASAMYPEFIKKAKADKNDQAVMSFMGAMAAEKAHAKLYSLASANLKSWKAVKKFIVCQTCGYTTDELDIKLCPVCAQPRSQFKEIE